MKYLESLFDTVASVEINLGTFWLNIAIVCGIGLVLGFLARLLFGKSSGLKHAISSAFGILFVYMLGAFLYGTDSSLSGLLSTLPFVAVKDGMMAIFSFEGAGWQAISAVLLQMVILAFLVNLMDILLPKGKNILAWLLFRLIAVALAVASQTLIVWLSNSFLPESFLNYAPVVLIGILVASLLLGALKFIVGIALATVNPVIAAFYTFFFSNLVGKQISKALLTTALLSLLVYAMNHFGYVVISLAGITLTALLPVTVILLALWYVVHQLL